MRTNRDMFTLSYTPQQCRVFFFPFTHNHELVPSPKQLSAASDQKLFGQLQAKSCAMPWPGSSMDFDANNTISSDTTICHLLLDSCSALCSCSSLRFGQGVLLCPEDLAKPFFCLPASVYAKHGWGTMSPIKCLGSHTWCYIREGVTAISSPHAHTEWMTTWKCCTVELCFLPHRTSLHFKLALRWHKLSCLHDSPKPSNDSIHYS